MGFIIDGTVNIDADISKFSDKMNEIESKYAKAKEKVESEKISTAPLSDDKTKGDVESSYDYMLNSFSQAKTVLESLQNVGTSLPQNIQRAISSLVGGIDQSLTSLTGSVTTVGKKMKTSFNDVGFNNSIRFASESVQSYTKDLQSAIESAQSLSKRSRAIVDQNVGQIAAVVSPAISRMSIHDKTSMSDSQIVEQMMTGRDYSHIPALLRSVGLNDDKQMREALNFAVKTSTSRIFRRDAATGYRYAGMKDSGNPILVSDMVQGAYKDALFTGGRYIDEKVTPTPKTNGALDKEKTRAYYQAIRREVMRGNSVAYNAARDTGLIQQLNGEYSFAREGDVLNNPSMLNQFAGLVTREAHHALQGQPQHRRRLDDPNNQSALLGKDSTRIREARYLMNLDQRPDAAPYVAENYQIPEGIGYRTGKMMSVPELKIPETINIPRMTVRQTANGAQLMVPRRNKDNNLVYEPNLNFQWQKQGVQETLEDEWVTMGRNPVIDRLERLSKRTDLKPELQAAIAGFKFEDRTFGRGYDKNNEAVTGAPLIVDVPLDYFYDRNKHGEMQFRTKENGDRESYFSGNNETLINEMYKGNIRPVLSYGGKNLDYRVFAGKTTGGGSLKLMLNDAYEALEKEDADRGLPSMLNFFNEIGPNGKLINPETGKEFENTEAANAAYAKWFDARNKILSHSTPIESLGGKTPTAALVNLDAAYKAMGTPKSHRFDGGGFIDPDVYTQDFQARMGPAKFLAQRFDWKQWFKDTGYAYQGGEFEGDTAYHFFMPGMATSADDYKKYRAALQNGIGSDAKSFTIDGKTIDFGGQSFKDWRDQRFVDVMSDDFKAVLFDTTLKSTAKLSSVTPEQYQKIAEATQGKEGTAFTSDQMMQIKNGMVPLSTKQQTELFGMMADPEYGFGLRLMKDTENYAGKKDFWSPAYMSAVMMTPALMRQSQENYDKAFQELSTPEGIIKRMFSGNDIDSLRVQKDPSLIYRDKFIQQSIQAEINDLEDKQMRGYAYMPGSAQMLLATANPTFLASIGKDLTGKELTGIASELNVGEHGVIAPTVSKEGTINWTRSPYAPGASFFAAPYTRTAANRYGLSSNSAMFNVEDFYTLNTGDFDGDFVWAYQTLKNDEDFKQRTEERNRRVQEVATRRQAEEERIKAQNEAINGKQDATVEHDVTGFGTATLRANNTLGPIGAGFKAGQAGPRMMNVTAEELAYIDDYGNKTYADAIDMVKHTDVRVAKALGVASEAMRTRQPIERMTDALLSEKETGTFGATDIFKYGLPTYIDPIGTSILAGAASGRRVNVNYGDRIKTAIRDNIEHRYAGGYQEERDLADWYGNLLGGKLSGEFQISTLQDLSEGRAKLGALGNRIKAISDNNPQAEELKDLQDLYRHAENALKLEETLGYNEGNVESIRHYNAANHWDNPVQKYAFKTKSEQDAATILFEREQAARYEEAQQARKNEIAQVISEQTGKVPGKVDEGYLADRLMAAHMFTGFNWSNAKNWMDGTLRANGAVLGGLRREDGATSTFDVDYNAAVEEENRLKYTHGRGMSRKEQVARQILTGESFTDADALVGLAAHAYMDAYGSARALSGRTSQGDIKTSAKEAADTAYAAFEEELLGKNGVLTDEQKKARKDAGGIAFTKDETGLITANYGIPEDQLTQVQRDTLTRINNKLALASRTSWANQESSLDKTAAEFYEEAFTNAAGEHMIMTEGTPFELDENGKLQQVASRRREGHNGIWMRPTRDGKEVIDFERYSKDASGHTVVSNAGMYFTPDMIKKDDNGDITVVDWKSSQHGQKDALFQMGFYAHQLEQLGRQYHETGDENLKWYGQFIDKDTGRSRVTGLQAVNLFGKPGEQVLSYKYTQEWGDQVSKAVEGGMQNLAEDAKKGFYAQIKDDIGVRIGDRQVGGSRPTVAPEIKEEDAHFSNLEEAGLINRLLNPLRMNDEVAAGRTGVKDSEGNYIDQDKSYLVAKYMKDKEELDEINAFANKQNRYLNNRSFEQLDPFTRNIDSLRQKFTEDQYATLQKYMRTTDNGVYLQHAPDLDLMSKDFSETQHEALQTTMRLMGLRRQYVDQLGETMPLDYNNILYGEGDQLSKLRSGTAKYQRDLSALQEVRAESTLYNAKTGRFKTKEELDAEIEAQKENETQEQYNARVEKSRKENEDLAKQSERFQTKYDTQEKSIREAFGTFEGGWIENFKKSAEYLDSGLGGLFKDGSIDAAVTSLQSRAREYTREADTKLPDETYVHGTDERNAIASLVTRLQERSQEFEALKGSSLESLLGFGKDYNTARINAAMTGTQVSAEDMRKKAVYDFANAFVKANPSASAQQLMKGIGVFENNYDKQIQNQEAFRDLHQENAIANIQSQNAARQENLERQYNNAVLQQRMRYSSSRLANALYGVEQRRDSAQAQYDNINRQVEAEKRTQSELKMRMDNAAPNSKEYKDAANAYAQSEERLKGLESAAGTAKEQLNQLNSVGTVGSAVFGSLSQSVNMLITRFGRQLFQKALTEAKRFVKEFNTTMTSIQMITLKTDEQMSKIGDGLISKAKELKVSIGDLTKSAETLYRQGLSDEEVNERLDVIAKFSKVSGTKTDAATKLITVAMNTGLASDPQVVADIVTALGDNAATNASEIEKGIEKAGAAAAADGTTFAQLASMLTAITSTTQIGGNVAGRTLNTIFGRMNKIGTGELITDENGNKISGSAVAKLLKAQGINTYDEVGNKRSSYDVLYDLSRKWETMSDAEQQQIATAIAGTRQYSNFAAIMQGMSEGKVDEYMTLAGNAEGITDQKYDIYLKSLQASLTDLKNTFDSLVQDLTKSGIAQKVIKGLTNIVQGVDNLVNSEGGLAKIVGLMIRLSVAMAAMKSGNPYAMLAGAAVAGISLVALHASGEQTSNTKTSEQVLEESRTQASEKYSSSTNEIERARELKAKGSNRTKEEEQEYNSLISKFKGTYSITGKAGSEYTDLGDTLSDASKHVEELEAATKNLGSSAKSASEGLSDYEQALIDYYETQRNSDQIEAEYGDAPAAGETAAKKYKELTEEAAKQDSGIENVEQYEGVLWNYNKETGEISLADNWYENLNKIRQSDIAGNMKVSGAFMTDILPKAIEGRYITGNVGEGFDYDHYSYGRRGAEGLIDLFHNYSQYRYDYDEGNAKDWLFGDEYTKYHTTAADDPHMQLFMEQLMKYVIQRYSEYHPEENTGLLNAAQAMEEMVTPILPEDMKGLAPFIGKALASRFSVDNAEDINKVFQDALIYAEGGEENRRAKSLTAKRNRLLELAVEGNYDPVSAERERQLRELGIQEGEEGDYYISEDGQILSYEDVSKQYKDYQNLINRQAWTYTTSGKESGTLKEIKQGMDFESPEKAEEYLNSEKTSWYFKDNEGNITYVGSEAEGNKLQQEYFDAGKARVKRTYKNYNTGATEVYEGLDKSEEAEAFERKHEEDKANAFEIRINGTDQRYAGSKAYGSKAQAEQAAAIANAVEAEAYQKRVAEAEATRHGEIVGLYGKEAGDLIYQQLNGQAPEGTYVALGANRQFLKAFDNEEAAAIYQHENTEFINNATGESFGFGEEGRLAAQQAKDNGEFLEYYIDGQYLGRGAEGLKRANEIRANGGIYKYTNDEGETEYTLDKAEAEEYTTGTKKEYEEAIQRRYEEKLQKAMYDNAGYFSGNGYGNQAGIGYIGEDSWQSWSTPYIIEEYTDEKGRIRYRASHNNNVQYEEGDLDDQGRIKSLVLEANQEYGPHGFVAPVKVSSDEIYTDNFEGISTQSPVERIEALKFYVDSLVGAIPDLKDVDPQVVLEVWGQLPEEIQETITATGEVGEEALKTVKSASDAVLAAKPQFKAVKNHFMAGASTTYGQWQTENNYATTSDAMLRMIQDHPEINDLQSLLTYVNENDISEWSTLNTNKDFARLVAPIQLDHGIIQNSQEQQDEIYDQMIRLLYKNGRDYGERQLSVSQKAGFAQSGYNKLFAKSDRERAIENERQRLIDLGLDPHSRRFGDAMTRFYQSLGPDITYFDSQQAASEEAQKRANEDLRLWQDARDAAFDEEFYRKELTAEEKENGYSINSSGYIVDKEGNLTGSRVNEKGFIVDLQGNKLYKEQYYTDGSLNQEAIDYASNQWDQSYRQTNPYVDIDTRQNEYLKEYQWINEDEKKYLKEAVGEQIYDRLINKEASAEEVAFARQMIGNRAVGLTSLTTSQQLSGLKDLRRQINQGRKIGEGEGDYQTTIAAQYLNGWSGAGEYLALLSAKGTDKFKEMGGQKRLAELEQSLDNFQENAEIKFNIEGVQQLEEAGKVAEGTAAKLERLQKGGDIAIKVSYEIQSEAYSTAQLGARLNNGTRTEQLEAIKSITGYSDAQIEKMGFAAALTDANTLYGSQNNLQIASLEEYYKAATTDEERALIDRIAHNAGYVNAYDDRGVMLNGRYRLGNNVVDRESGFANAQQLWTGSKIAEAQDLILSGKLTASTEGKEDLYSAAASKMGEQGTEYMRMLQAGTYSDEALATQLAKANAEVANSAIKATQEDLQKNLELSTDKYIRDNAQEIAQNRTTLTTGSNAEQLSLYSQFLGNQRSVVGAQYALTNYTGLESASTLASYLSMDEKDVRASLSTDEGRASIQSALEEKTKNMYSMMAKSVTNDFDFDASTGDLSDLKTSLLEAADKTTGEAREFLLNLANSISDAGDIIGQSDASFSDEYDKVMAQFGDAQQKRSGYDWLRNNLKSVASQERIVYTDDNGKYIPGGKTYTLPEMIDRSSNNPQMAKLLSEHPELVTGLNLYDQGRINDTQFNSLVDYAQYGQATPGLTSTITQGVFGQTGLLDAEGMFKIPDTDQEAQALINNFKEIQAAGGGTSEMLDILFEQYPDLKDFFETGDKNKAAGALKEVNSQMTKDKVTQASKYTKASENVADAMAKIKKGGKDAAEGYAMLRENARDRQDLMTAVKVNAVDSNGNYKAGSKLSEETRNVIADAFENIDADDLKDYTAEQMEELLSEIPDAIDEELVDDLNAGIEGLHIPVDLSGIKVDGEGYVDLSALEERLNAADTEIFNQLKAMIEAQGGEWGSVKFKVDKNGDLVVVSATTSFNKSGKYSSGGSGKSTSSSGKSAAQTAIDAAKHYVSEAQHYTTMSESDLYHPDKINDFSAYAGAVQANVFTLMQEGQVYQDMIDYLEEQRASVSEGTDDWWDLTEAIEGYEESLAQLEEQIDSVNQKLLDEAKEEYGYKITSAQHDINMSTTDRTFYQRTNDYDAELASIDDLNVEYGALEETYREAISMYKALQANVEEGTDQWWAYQQEIDTTTESLAELKNTVAALNAEKLNIIIEKQTNEDKPENNAYSLMDLYKTRYLNNEDYTAYETVMDERKTLLRQSIADNAAQINELENLLDEFEEGSDEWISTRDQIWTIKLDSATKENEYIELEKELAEQRLAQISQTYERGTAYENHANTMYDTYGNMYESVSNYSGYRSTLREQVSMFQNLRESAEEARDAALEQMATLRKGTPEWYAARDAVYQYEEAIASAYASEIEKKYAIEQSLANELIEQYTDDMSLFDQRAKLLADEKKKYDNANDYAGYMAMMAQERDVLQEQQDSRQDYLAQLQARLANTTIGTDAWKNLRKEILQVEQAISSTDVTLANFENDLEKTKLDYYVEKMDRAQADRTHGITMIQYEETRYQNAGELSNYGIMLEKENEARTLNIKALERDLKLLEEELEELEVGSKQYQRVIDLIKKKEEAIKADSNAIEKNNKLLEENRNKIIQTRKTLEDQVDAEIKKRKEQAKTELNATVNLQSQILNVVKQRYRDEWDIIKQDQQKKKDALAKEKELINERLQARKQAMDAEDKYNELRELQNQLALIANDPTRTKDAKELSKRIADIRKDISWDRAAEEAQTATERIDDEIRAMDEWIQINEENLNYMLEDAHNFSEEITSVLSGSYEEIVTWMMDNNVEFKNSLDEAQQQMIDGWETTWKTMHGIVDTYWDQINDVLSSKDNFIKFMQESVDYITASEAGKATMMYAWSKGYDAMTGAEAIDEEAENYNIHSHEEDGVDDIADAIAQAMAEATKWTYNSDWWTSGLTPDTDLLAQVVGVPDSYDDIGLPASVISDLVPSIEQFLDKYSGVGVEQDNTPPSSYAQVNVGQYTAKTDTSQYRTTSTGKTTSTTGTTSPSTGSTLKTYSFTTTDSNGFPTSQGGTVKASSYDEAKQLAAQSAADMGRVVDVVSEKKYAKGGLIDFTGPAWVDGSKQRPESILDSYDTESLRMLANALSYVRVTPGVSPSSEYFNSNNSTIGDINITINEAKLNNDADYEEVARRVGAAFTKQLSKEGLNLNGYSF